MPEPGPRLAVHVLSDPEWRRRLAAAERALPFAGPPWPELGLAERPELRPVPLAIGVPDRGELLAPVFRSAAGAQLGCFGYGMVYPTADWRGQPPDFDLLAYAVCGALGVDRLGTLLPPTGAVPAADRLTGHWPGRAGRPTFLLDLTGGPEAVWAGAKGSARTAVRRAERLGYHARRAEPADAPAVARLYRETMRRNGASAPLGEDHFRALLGADAGTLSVVVAGEEVSAAAIFVAWAGTAYHVFQLTSATGRRGNAGQLAFWAAVRGLAERRVAVLDLGAAAGAGQEFFKTSWGGRPRPTRHIGWSRFGE